MFLIMCTEIRKKTFKVVQNFVDSKSGIKIFDKLFGKHIGY